MLLFSMNSFVFQIRTETQNQLYEKICTNSSERNIYTAVDTNLAQQQAAGAVHGRYTYAGI